MTSVPESESWFGLSLAQLDDKLKIRNVNRCHFGAVIQALYGYRRAQSLDALPRSIHPFLTNTPVSTILDVQRSTDGTVKWLLGFPDGTNIETVLIPESGRYTLCVSSQAGCAYGCAFCATGAAGLKRHLSLSEIIEQLFVANMWLARHTGSRVTNLVFMGMGEPLHNIETVLNACEILCHDSAFGLSKYKVTISTVGLVPAIYKLCGRTHVSLALSLHAPNDEIRRCFVPVARKYTIEQTLAAARAYIDSLDDGRKVFIEYTLISGYNDSVLQAEQLAQLLKDLPCKINIIPCNPVTTAGMIASDQVYAFCRVLQSCGYVVTTRQRRGVDIEAACGQLARSA